MKKGFLYKAVALMACLMCSIGAVAQEAYSVFTYSDSTLTFYYDDLRAARTGSTYSLNTGNTEPEWRIIKEQVSTVVFDTTFVDARPTTTYCWFGGMYALDSISGIKYLKTDSVTNMHSMFGGCFQLASLDLSGFNTAKVTTMVSMFYNCVLLTSLDLSSFNTENVRDLGYMFSNCRALTSLDLSSFNTSNVTRMEGMFEDCYSLTSIELSTTFNTAKVTNMEHMFENCHALTSLDLRSFNTANVTDMARMFSDCNSLTSIELSTTFNTANVTNMEAMFWGCNSLASLDLSGFNTSNVTNMITMFSGCSSLSALDLSAFNTSNVIDIHGMFGNCKLLKTLDLSGFNTEKVKYMGWMFSGCNHLKTIYAGNGWSTDSVASSEYMFYGCTSLVGEQGTVYDESHIDAAYAHIDGGPSNPGYLSIKREAYAVHDTDTTLVFYYDDMRSTHTSASYLLNTGLTIPGWSDAAVSITKVVFDSTFVAARPTTTYSWFSRMNQLDTISGISYLNTDSVTDMRRMFSGCESLKALDLSGFNTSNVTNMWDMFGNCKSLTSIELSGFNTSNVTNMARMFSGCNSLEALNLSGFNTSNVTDMSGMFANCGNLTSLDLNSFTTEKVKYMGWMFSGCDKLTSLDLSAFNSDNVTEVEYMFQGCKHLVSLDLSSFNTKNVTDMEAMFNGCNHLKTIYAGNGWSTDAVTKSENMFSGCTNLVGGQGTAYDENYVDVEYAHIDGGPNNPGYLTWKDVYVPLRGDVNGDGEVNIADVNCLTDVILGGPDIYEGRTDVNEDGEVTIADINALIDIILGSSVPTPTPDHDYVDLGLPSGTLWATCNVGADIPEQYGDYFAWGETELKDVYDCNTYKWSDGGMLTKYCTQSTYGTVDDKTELETEDDAAYVNWGPSWRIPSQKQLEELNEQCTWTWTTRNGVKGQLATGPNGNKLFIPTAGFRMDDALSDAGTDGRYWSRTLYPTPTTTAFNFFVNSAGVGWGYHIGNRYYGYSVRAVRVSEN